LQLLALLISMLWGPWGPCEGTARHKISMLLLQPLLMLFPELLRSQAQKSAMSKPLDSQLIEILFIECQQHRPADCLKPQKLHKLTLHRKVSYNPCCHILFIPVLNWLSHTCMG